MDTPQITDAEIRAMITMLRQRQDPIDLALANDLEQAYLRIQD